MISHASAWNLPKSELFTNFLNNQFFYQKTAGFPDVLLRWEALLDDSFIRYIF